MIKMGADLQQALRPKNDEKMGMGEKTGKVYGHKPQRSWSESE